MLQAAMDKPLPRQSSPPPGLRRRGRTKKHIQAVQARKDMHMSIDKNRIKGAAKQAVGATKESVGNLIGDKHMVLDGKAQQVEGKVQSAVGKASDTLKDVAGR